MLFDTSLRYTVKSFSNSGSLISLFSSISLLSSVKIRESSLKTQQLIQQSPKLTEAIWSFLWYRSFLDFIQYFLSMLQSIMWLNPPFAGVISTIFASVHIMPKAIQNFFLNISFSKSPVNPWNGGSFHFWVGFTLAWTD